jgi:Methylase involved in ubiquinone/menaquinone biosynthesis
MNDSGIGKFENPIRIAELKPKNTLIKAGFKENMILCDIGAGTGIFSFPAAEISSNDIYALEKSDSMIELLKSRMAERNTQNLKIRKVDSTALPLENSICDMVILVTVLHELENKEFMQNEIKRILKEKGKLMIIEFHKRKTPMGPPIDHRISEEYTEEIFNSNGFKTIDKFSLGENLYGVIFEF